ncbi:MAG TPA: S9 family peptidase [Candidatus Limnocylindria bacterium]|nr:S9 family peptidase [Candidatus Limnocylindria bacterium]
MQIVLRLLTTATALAVVSAPALAAPPVYTPADDAQLVGLSAPAFSPDGRTIALVRTVQDVAHDKSVASLALVDVATGTVTQPAKKRTGVAQPAYAADGTRLAFLAEDQQHHRQIDVLNLRTGAVKQLTTTAEGVQQFAWRPDGTALAYVTADPAPKALAQHHDFFEITDDDYLTRSDDPPSHLWLVGAEGGRPQRLTSGTWSVSTSYPPSPPASPLSWSPDGTHLLFGRVPNTHDGDAYRSETAVLDLRTHAVTALTGRHEFESFAAFAPDGAHIAYLANRDDDPNNENGVYVTTLRHAEHGEAGRGTLLRAFDHNTFRVQWLNPTTMLVGAHDGTRNALWLLRTDGRSTRIGTDAVAPNQGFWLEAAVAKQGALAYVGTTTTHPAELYYQARPAAAPRRLTHVNDLAVAHALGAMVALTWTTPNGMEHDGTLTYPAHYVSGKKYPLVLVVHGGPTFASTLTWDSLAQSLAGRGMFVFQPNYRGSDNEGNAYQRAIYMDAGDGPDHDVMAGLAAVEKLGVVDENKIVVSGWSYGGFMTSWLMTHEHVWKAAFSGAAVNDWVDMYDLGDGNVQIGFTFKGSPHVGNNLADYRAQSPITYATQVTCPVLIVSDIGDARVPVTQSFRMYRTLKDNGKRVRFIGIPVNGHNPGDIVRRIDRERLWADWAANAVR